LADLLANSSLASPPFGSTLLRFPFIVLRLVFDSRDHRHFPVLWITSWKADGRHKTWTIKVIEQVAGRSNDVGCELHAAGEALNQSRVRAELYSTQGCEAESRISLARD